MSNQQKISDMITKERLDEYKALCKSEFGKDVSDQEALGGAIKLLNLMKIIYRPMEKEEYDEYIREQEK